jgi:hypothetical protein
MYRFHNFSVTESIEHMRSVIALLNKINPRLRIILTVSPVPLAATMTPRHVLQATTYSKSVLRVWAEQMVIEFDHVDYFASYELILGTCSSTVFFSEDRRSVSAAGVAHVMNCFFAQFGADIGRLQRPSQVETASEGRAPSGPSDSMRQSVSMGTGMNHWPADPFVYAIPKDKSAICESAEGEPASIKVDMVNASANGERSIDEFTRENASIRAELAAIRASTSWRITYFTYRAKVTALRMSPPLVGCLALQKQWAGAPTSL